MLNLPPKYKWLESIGTLPKLVSAALQYLGVREIPGSASNPIIMDMARGLNVSDIYSNDDISWCALFINHLLRITGKPPLDYKGDRYNILRAKGMLQWGNVVGEDDIRLGDIVILKREGGGHVFIAIAMTKKGTIVGIGGNQSNSVSFSEFDQKRIIGVRRYYATGMPSSAKKYVIDGSGILSTNES